MTARAFTGLRVVLVAAFNRRYHRSGLALAAALEGLGCEVRPCEERRGGWNALLGRSLATRLAACLRAGPVDVVLVFKGASLARAAVAELGRRCGGRWFSCFPDGPYQLGLSSRLARAYDRFFTHDCSSLARHRAVGAQAHYLAFGCDPEYLQAPPPGRQDAHWAAPLVFVGSRDDVREPVLQALAGVGLVAWGPGWPRGPLYGADFVSALAGARVGVNVHQQFGERGDPARYGTGANMRVFELAAVGTPQLSDAKVDIARHFTPDGEIVLYRSVAELVDRARVLLADDTLRRRLAVAARERALREHTWRHRLEELLTVTLR